MPELLAGPYCHGARRPNNRPAKGPRAQKEFVHVIWGTSFVCWESVLFFSHLFFFCGVVVICFILQRVAPVTMEMDSRSIVSEDITGALLLCCKGEFILAKHRKGERKMFLYVRVCVCVYGSLCWDCLTNGYLLLVTSGDGRKDLSLTTFMTFFFLRFFAIHE